MTLTAKQIANRNAKREADFNREATRILARAISTATAPVEETHTVDYAGRRVRITLCTKDEVAAFLRGNRVVDQVDILEEVGEAQFNNMYNNGSIVRDPKFNRYHKNNLYWITKKAAEVYGIPARFQLCGGAFVDLLDA